MIWQPPKDKPVYNLDDSYGIVKEKLCNTDIAQQCRNSGVLLQADGTILIKYLDQDYFINVKSGDVTPKDNFRPLSLREKILVLHYFTRATGAPATGKQITFRDLPGGLVYYPTFIKRTIQPLLDTYGKDASLFIQAGQTLGARKGEIGDAPIIVDAFPRVPVTFILWQGDEELTPDLNLLFDANILAYLEPEDVTIVCETITWRLINAVKKA